MKITSPNLFLAILALAAAITPNAFAAKLPAFADWAFGQAAVSSGFAGVISAYPMDDGKGFTVSFAGVSAQTALIFADWDDSRSPVLLAQVTRNEKTPELNGSREFYDPVPKRLVIQLRSKLGSFSLNFVQGPRFDWKQIRPENISYGMSIEYIRGPIAYYCAGFDDRLHTQIAPEQFPKEQCQGKPFPTPINWATGQPLSPEESGN